MTAASVAPRPRPRSAGAFVTLRGRALACLLLASAIAPQVSSALPADEAALHAAYVINFVRYTRWPGAHAAGDPYVIAVLGTPASATTLHELARRAGPVDGHPVVVRTLSLNAGAPARSQAIATLRHELADADVVYVADSHSAWNDAVIAAVKNLPVLTVGVGPDFVKEGGMLGFIEDGGRVSFTANEAVIRRASVDVSARVLVLARPTPGGR